jgi:hypothetical protein
LYTDPVPRGAFPGRIWRAQVCRREVTGKGVYVYPDDLACYGTYTGETVATFTAT